MLNGKNILVTGGTGSFGQAFCRYVLTHFKPNRLIVYSRDEFKQSLMQEEEIFQSPCMRYFLGDIRDLQRLTKAMAGVDYVIHAAALKQVPAAEYNPNEFIQTNILGSVNVCEAALANNVECAVALSTDKAVTPVNLYGATKLCAEKSFIANNSYSGKNRTRFSVVRYGNVLGSRGSVIPLFLKQQLSGEVTITDHRMTRFFITLEQGVKFVLQSLFSTQGGEIFVPKLPSCTITNLAKIIVPHCSQKIIGLRPGEKLHETLIPIEESRSVYDCGKYYVIAPLMPYWATSEEWAINGKLCENAFSYTSDNNTQWLSKAAILRWLKNFTEEKKDLAVLLKQKQLTKTY